MSETQTKVAELISSSYIDGFNSDPNIFLKFMNSSIPIAVVSNIGENGLFYPRAFLPAPNGGLFGGFQLTNEGLTEKENEQFSKILAETGVNEKSSIQLKDNQGNVCKTVVLRKAIVIATVSVGKESYSIEKAKWELEINTIIELGDFKSQEHIVLTAGSYVLTFNDELSRKRAVQSFKTHYDESYAIASDILRRNIKESAKNV